ncbi:MAG: galactokinase [Opitutaceae bacterium]
MKAALTEKFRGTFGHPPDLIAHAPGRIEFIGNHTDYNGGPVLGAAIDRSVWVALARRADGVRRFASDAGRPLVATQADRIEKLAGADSWANYPLGVLTALAQSGRLIPAGFDFMAASDLPAGAGLSSSAAIELASALVFAAAVGEPLEREELVRVARHAENQFVGVPSGILDQGVSAFGKKDHLVLIDCRVPSFSTVPLPRGANFWIFNTHTKHVLVDGLYASRHRECMAAAAALGVARLADVSPGQLEQRKGQLDLVAIKRARHIVGEVARVTAAVATLRAGDLAAVGRLLTASHRSSQVLFENSTAELDFLVDTLERTEHVLGARLTGGGFGGAVMALTSGEFTEASARAVASAYTKKFGVAPDILRLQTADGAQLFPE